MSAEIVPLNAENNRRGLFGRKKPGRHSRTPQTWAKMTQENAELRADLEKVTTERDEARRNASKFANDVIGLRKDVKDLNRRLLALEPAAQTETIVRTASQQEETQPIAVEELFATDPMEALRPKVRVHDFQPAPDAGARLVTRIVPTTLDFDAETVPDVEETQIMALWNAPLSQGSRHRRSA